MDTKLKDVCYYKIFLKEPSIAAAEATLTICYEISKAWTTGYIWQVESFAIRVVDNHLEGSFSFGDCIEDEWFVVWILHSLSERLPDVYVSITDTDGEFLLIESAMHLPRWLEPESAEHRVWIVGGKLVIIPASAKAIKAKQCPALPLDDALRYLRESKPLMHLPKVQQDAFARISSYPEQAKKEMHHVQCKLPRSTATILQRDPQLVAKACTALFYKGPEEDRLIENLHKDEDDVEMVVKMTRTLYAQIKGMRFTPPASYKFSRKDDAAETGCKLFCGLQIARRKDDEVSEAVAKCLQKPLLTDSELACFAQKPDSDAYLHVNLEELENRLNDELPSQTADDDDGETAIRKMVDQMQRFIGDEVSGMEGVEVGASSSDQGYSDNESDESEESESDDEPFAGGQDFMSFLRSSVGNKDALRAMQFATQRKHEREDEEESDEDDDVPDMKTYMQDMDEELKRVANKQSEPKGKAKATPLTEDDENDSLDDLSDFDDDLQVDFNLARNMLESLRSEGGMTGPAANLLASFGLNMPRDEGSASKP